MKFELQRASIYELSYENKTIDEIIWMWNLPNNFKINYNFAGINTKVFIELNDLEELIKFQKAVDQSLIISDDTITIYDDWIE